MIIRVYLDGSRSQWRDVTVDSEATCADVIAECRGDDTRKNRSCYLAELCMGYERSVDYDERPFEILQQWGSHSDKVQFIVRQRGSSHAHRGHDVVTTESASESSPSLEAPPDILLGTDFSLEKLVQIVEVQREQLDEQQKMLTNKTLRLSSLQHQQLRHKAQVAEKNERLTLLRDRIREKEAKLKKLKSIKALVLEQGQTNHSFSKELELMKHNFDKKEHELVTVIDKMEMLTRKLKELHQERSFPKNTDGDTEKEKLQGQIKDYNLINEQNAKLLQQKQDVLTHRQKQIAELEQRICKVRSRLSSNHHKTKHAAENKRRDVPLKDSSATCRPTESSAANQAVQKCTTKYKTLPHSLKFADVDLIKTVVNPSRGMIAGTNDETGRKEISTTTAGDDGKGKPGTVLQNPGSVLERQNREVDVIDGYQCSSSLDVAGFLSKAALERPPSTGHRISSLLMNHFAPRPYESKYSVAKSNAVLSPSDLLSTHRCTASESEAAGSISDSTEILITDPPAPTPAGSGPPAEAGFPLESSRSASTTWNLASSSRIHTNSTDSAMESTEKKPESVEMRKLAQPPSATTSLEWKKTVGHVKGFGSRLQSNPSSETVQTSDVNPPSQNVLVTNSSRIGQGENIAVEQLAGSGERVAEKSKTSDARHQFFLDSRSGAAQISSSSKRKAASFDETFSDSRSTEEQLQRTSGSFQRSVNPPSSVSKASSGIAGSPKTAEAIDVKPQHIKPASCTSVFLSKTDSQVSTGAEPKLKSELATAVIPKHRASGDDGSSDALQQRYPWSSKSKDLKLKLLDLLLVNSSASSPSTAASESRLQSPKLSSGRPASPLASQELSCDLKNASAEQKPTLDAVASASAKDELRSADSTETSSLLSESNVVCKAKSDSGAGEGGQDSMQASIPEPLFPRYQYAAKNLTAKMYLRKLGTEVADQHSRDLSQLYGRFSSGMSREEQNSVQMVESAEPTLPTKGSQETEVTSDNRPFQSSQSSVSVDFKVADKIEVEVISKKAEELPTEAGRGLGASVVGPDLERQIYKPTIPRPVRRRMSSGDVSEDYPGKSHHRDENSSSSQSSGPVTSRNAGSGVVKKHSDSPAHNQDDSFCNPATGFQSSSVEPYVKSVEQKNSFSRQPFRRQGNLKRAGKPKLLRRVSFEPLALLLDASLEGELDLVEKTAREVPNISASNDEGITALHNAICAGHFDIVKFLVEFGCDVNSPDSDGWTPLHCAASCNNLAMVQFLVEHGACVFATTFSDQELASAKCEEDEDGYDTCSQYLRDIQDRMGVVNDGIVYAVFDYEAENPDELSFRSGDRFLVLRKGDDCEQEWWWSRMADNEGYVPRNLIGLFPRVVPQWLQNVHSAS